MHVVRACGCATDRPHAIASTWRHVCHLAATVRWRPVIAALEDKNRSFKIALFGSLLSDLSLGVAAFRLAAVFLTAFRFLPSCRLPAVRLRNSSDRINNSPYPFHCASRPRRLQCAWRLQRGDGHARAGSYRGRFHVGAQLGRKDGRPDEGDAWRG